MPPEPRTCDVLVIGAGTAGERLAQRLEGTGREVVVVTAGLVGGECPFTGCMPSKSLLHDATGARTWEQAAARRDDVVDHLDDTQHAEGLVATGATLVRGRARIVGERLVEVVPGDLPATVGAPGERVTEPRRHAARDVVVATGAAPVVPPIDGLDDVGHWTSDDLYTTHDLPASVVVLGGGAIGAEAAQALLGFGADVVVVEREHRLVDAEDPAIGEVLADALRAQGCVVHLGEEASAVRRDGDDVVVTCASGLEVRGERLLVAVGRRPNRDGLGLETIGVAPDRLGEVDDQLRVPGTDWLWAVGDVNMLAPYTHGGNAQAEVVAEVLRGRDATYRAVESPRSIYTTPPVLAVGASAAEARDRGLRRTVLRHDAIARPTTDETGPGVAVLYSDDHGHVRGFAACGARADEYGTVMTLAVQAHLGLEDIARMQAAFPTHAEILPALARRALVD